MLRPILVNNSTRSLEGEKKGEEKRERERERERNPPIAVILQPFDPTAFPMVLHEKCIRATRVYPRFNAC